MFCPECGNKIVDNSAFCGECGTKLNVFVPQPQPQQMQQQAQLQKQDQRSSNPMSKKTIIMIMLVAFLVVICSGLYQLGKSLSKPEKLAERYFENVMAGNWEKVYDYYDIQNSPFLKKELFLRGKINDDGKELANYRILKNYGEDYALANNKKDSLEKTIYIEYREVGDQGYDVYAVELMKDKGKSFLFFDKWSIKLSDMIETYEISVPIGATVELDGYKLTEEYLSSDSYSDYIDGYTINSVFTGTHQIKVSQPNMEDVEETVEVISGKYNDYYLNSMDLKQEVIKMLEDKSIENLNTVIEKSLKQEDFQSISPLFVTDPNIQSNMESDYNYFKEDFENSEGEGINSVDIISTDTKVDDYVLSGVHHVDVRVNYRCKKTYTTKSWWTDEFNTYNKEVKNFEVYSYVYEDDQWLLTDASFYPIY